MGAVFLTNAVLYANLVPRLPEVRDGLGLTNASLGTALAAAPLGALMAGLFAPALIRRFGSAALASMGLVALAGTLFAVAFAGRWATLAAALFAMGVLDGVIDVGQNAHAFRVQRLYGRSIINAFHGMWSIGAVLGGLIGAAAAGLEVSLAVHFGSVAALFSIVVMAARTQMLPGPEDSERLHPESATAPIAAPLVVEEQSDAAAVEGARRMLFANSRSAASRVVAKADLLLAFGALAIAAAVIEDSGASWAAIYLRDELAAGAALAGLGFVALQTAMTIGRFTGDHLVDRFGQVKVVQVGGMLVAAGMGAALALPSVVGTMVGFAAAGLGVATLVPATMHAADELPGLPAGVGLTIVSWTLRIGFLASPPVIGAISDATSLRAALVGVPVAGMAMILLAPSVRPHAPN